jgi:putative PIN family toxin of toxin-antitoxin system
MKVFLDTNVLVSAVAARGLCADVLREVLVSHQLVVSDQLFEELKKVLSNKLKVPPNLISEFIEILQQDSHLSTPSAKLEIYIKDQDDLSILSAALEGSADIFITGDNELLDLKKVGHMDIVSPRSFWEKLKAQHGHKD